MARRTKAVGSGSAEVAVETDRLLSELERHARARLPLEATATGRLRLSELTALCGLPESNARATIYRLNEAGLARPLPLRGTHERRAHFYSTEDAINLLVACALIKGRKGDLKPRAAAGAVQAYRKRLGAFGSTHLVEAILKTSLQSFETLVLSRLVGALLALINSGQDLRPGTLVFIVRDGSRGKKDEEWARDQAASFIRRPTERTVALLGEELDLTFLDGLSKTVVDSRTLRILSAVI